jgi:hypothetical protein
VEINSLYVNNVEKSGVSVGADGVISGYTLDGSESSIKIVVTDKAGYDATSTLTLTPTKPSGGSSSKPSDGSSSEPKTSKADNKSSSKSNG